MCNVSATGLKLRIIVWLSLNIPMGGPDDVTMEINYGGVFEKGKSGLEYKGCESRTVWPVDADLLSYFKVKGLAEDVGFTNIEYVYYVIPWLSMEDGIRPLKIDYDSLDMAECARRAKKISAYIVYKVDEPVVIPPALPSCEAQKETYTSNQPKSADGKRVKHVATKRTCLRGKTPLQMLKFQAQDQRCHLKVALAKALLQERCIKPERKGPPPAAESTSPKQRVPLRSAKTQSSKQKASPVLTKAQQQFTNEFEDDRPDSPIPWDVLVGGGIHEYEEAYADLDTPPTTDEVDNMILSRRNKKKRVKIDEHTDYKKLKWKVGMTYGTMHKFKQAVIRFGLAQGYDLTFSVSNSKRKGLEQHVNVVASSNCILIGTKGELLMW
ncbi:hypothetical protein Cgig2_008070 [Carnegiea gigantea]|uniref:PB1-like domain-containing protein n=1 Tax=Carnegiea gigantea TaxID=171969 RepID=A0A9Q1L2H2_9CARY|nr:hypothetical protein Cgig2_008070 [Carnegiea gigantea]